MIEEALERMLDQLTSAAAVSARHDRLRQLVADAQTTADHEGVPTPRQLQDDLYDEDGLPR